MIAVHLCPQNPTTWRNCPRLPSRACKFTSSLAPRLTVPLERPLLPHAMAILQVHQASALKDLHKGNSELGLIQELRWVTDFTLRATKFMARAFSQAMSFIVVQERHNWLNLAEMRDADKVCFLETLISQGGLFGDIVKDFAQQFSVVKKQIEAIKYIFPLHESSGTFRPQRARTTSVAKGACLQLLHQLCHSLSPQPEGSVKPPTSLIRRQPRTRGRFQSTPEQATHGWQGTASILPSYVQLRLTQIPTPAALLPHPSQASCSQDTRSITPLCCPTANT